MRICEKGEQAELEKAFELGREEGRKETQPTINGYDIKHLELIAAVLQKENLPPERVTEALTDIGRIVAIVTEEFEKALRGGG